MQNQNFSYHAAFQRNLGWFTENDQQILRGKRVAIPGLGGVGGYHLHCFARLGIGKFNLADLDVFDLPNLNRQALSSMDSIGRPKIEVAQEFVKSINPEADVHLFPKGVTFENMEDFLRDVDVVVDTLDLFAMDLRIALYELAYQKGIPVVTAGPFGMGTALLAFNPKGMSFNQYFNLDRSDLTTEAKIIRFLAGVAPNFMHREYLRAPAQVNLFEKKLPSLAIGCLAASSAIGTAVVRILLEDPKFRWAPYGFHLDFYLLKLKKFYRPWGNRNPLQKLRIKSYHWFFKASEYRTPIR